MSGTLTIGRWLRALAAYAIPFILCALLLPWCGPELFGVPPQPGVTAEVQAQGNSFILYQLRLPRVILGLLVGGALAITGAGFQVILRNPLAEPYTIGATGGAAVGAVLAISIPRLATLFGPSVQVFALAGAAVSLGLVYTLARRPHGLSMNTLLLTGVTLSILCGGIIMFIRYFAAPEDHVRTTLWLMGGLGIVGYGEIATLVVLLLPGLALLLTQMPALNHLSLGDQMAAGHGVDVPAVQKMAFLGGGVLTAGAVSVAGPIGFVGLIVPHAVRRLSGYDQRLVLPASFFLGGAFLALCDTAARLLFPGSDFPVGVVTALVGGPLFIKILLGRRR